VQSWAIVESRNRQDRGANGRISLDALPDFQGRHDSLFSPAIDECTGYHGRGQSAPGLRQEGRWGVFRGEERRSRVNAGARAQLSLAGRQRRWCTLRARHL